MSRAHAVTIVYFEVKNQPPWNGTRYASTFGNPQPCSFFFGGSKLLSVTSWPTCALATPVPVTSLASSFQRGISPLADPVMGVAHALFALLQRLDRKLPATFVCPPLCACRKRSQGAPHHLPICTLLSALPGQVTFPAKLPLGSCCEASQLCA